MSHGKKWAIVTGASSGIGTALAEDAAARGYSLILVARRRDRLEELAKRLGGNGIETQVVATDLGTSDGVAVLVDATTKKGVVPDVFFNNAGYGTNGAFLDASVERELAMIDLNCRSLVELCHHYGYAMRKRGSGTIVNVGSVLSFMPAAYLAVYAATKAFVLSFSEALAQELQSSGVTVVALCPGATATEFSDVAKFKKSDKSAPFVQSAGDVSRTAWHAIDRGRTVAVSGTANKVTAFFLRHAPRAVTARISSSFRPA